MAAEDVLSEVLGHLQLRGEIFCCTLLGHDTSLSLPPGQAHFHVVERGSCWISLPAENQAEETRAGDLILLVSGSGHTISSDPAPRHRRSLTEVLPERYDADQRCLDLSDEPAQPQKSSGLPSSTELTCGRFVIDSIGSEALIEALPPLLILRGSEGAPERWLSTIMKLLAAETAQDLPGSSLARARFVDLILVGALRRWLQEHQGEAASWLAALQDPVAGRALSLLHANPQHPWTVPELANQLGLSRSPFASRFKAAVGQSPMKYLSSWRLRLAARQLRQGSSVSEVAQSVGYESAAAFSRAFGREMGVPPSSLRPKIGDLYRS
ncbi:MAG: AraC family transcriptional regulator [Acidobacteriota bacterium]